MSDKIENKLKEIVKLNSKILEEIEKRLDAAGLKAAQSAARFSSSMMKSISADDTINAILKRVSSFGGKGGQAAARAFSKEFKKGVKEATGSLDKLAGMMGDIDRRMTKLSERKTAGWSKAAGVQREIMTAKKAIEDQIALNKRLMTSVAYQAGKATDPAEQANLKNKYKQLKAVNKELEESVDLTKKMGVQARQLDVEEFIQDRKEKSFGFINKIRDKGNLAGDIATHAFGGGNFSKLGLPLLLTGVFEALKMMVQEAMAAGKVFRDTGQTGDQLVKSVGNAMETSRDMFKRGLIVDAKESAEAVAGIQDKLGQLAIPSELSDETAYLTKMFKMSSNEAADLVGSLYRFNGRNVEKTQQTLKYVAVFANKNGLNTNTIMKDMASHAEDFANAGNMSAEAFARAAADSRRIGVNMSTMTSLANSLVNDFEGALHKQAELSTMFPGMDMTKVTYASQFGTNEDVLNEVKSMINNSGYDINALPRSFKNNLQKNLGMSATDLANIAGSSDISKFASPEKQEDLGMQKQLLTQVFDTASGGMGEIIKILRTILFSLGPLALLGKVVGWTADGTKAQAKDKEVNDTDNKIVSDAKPKNMNDSDYVNARMHHKGGIVGKHGTPVKIPKFHSGLLSNEMFAILEKGEAVLTEEMQRGVGAISLASKANMSSLKPKEQSAPSQTIAPTVDRVMAQSVKEDATQANVKQSAQKEEPESVVLNTANLERLLVELISVTKNSATSIELDGQKVGRLINKSFSRTQ